MSSETMAIGCDHAGFIFKNDIIKTLEGEGYGVKDFGTYSEESVDYPDFVHPLAGSVENNESRFGILLCGSGNGVAMAANKHPGVRAALCWNEEIAKLAREHNDANIICIPSRFVTREDAIKMAKTFLNTPFEGGRHQRRVNKINLNM